MKSQKITSNDLSMMRRWYRDACGTALAMDLVGERWTLLIARELLLGPRRFGAISGALEGRTSITAITSVERSRMGFGNEDATSMQQTDVRRIQRNAPRHKGRTGSA